MSNRGQTEGEVKVFKPASKDQKNEDHKRPRLFVHRPDEDPAEVREAKKNTSYIEAARTLEMGEFSKFHKKPCVRDSLLPAIGGGFATGAVRFIIGGSVMAACNWASGCFVGVSLVAYQYCQRRRDYEKDGIRQAVQVLDAKQAIKDAKKGGAKQEPDIVRAAKDITKHAPSTDEDKGDPRQGVPFWSSFKFW